MYSSKVETPLQLALPHGYSWMKDSLIHEYETIYKGEPLQYYVQTDSDYYELLDQVYVKGYALTINGDLYFLSDLKQTLVRKGVAFVRQLKEYRDNMLIITLSGDVYIHNAIQPRNVGNNVKWLSLYRDSSIWGRSYLLLTHDNFVYIMNDQGVELHLSEQVSFFWLQGHAEIYTTVSGLTKFNDYTLELDGAVTGVDCREFERIIHLTTEKSVYELDQVTGKTKLKA